MDNKKSKMIGCVILRVAPLELQIVNEYQNDIPEKSKIGFELEFDTKLKVLGITILTAVHKEGSEIVIITVKSSTIYKVLTSENAASENELEIDNELITNLAGMVLTAMAHNIGMFEALTYKTPFSEFQIAQLSGQDIFNSMMQNRETLIRFR